MYVFYVYNAIAYHACHFMSCHVLHELFIYLFVYSYSLCLFVNYKINNYKFARLLIT